MLQEIEKATAVFNEKYTDSTMSLEQFVIGWVAAALNMDEAEVELEIALGLPHDTVADYAEYTTQGYVNS